MVVVFSAVTRELPKNVPYAAKLSFIKGFQSEWLLVANKVADEVHSTLTKTLMELIGQQFVQYQHLAPRLKYVLFFSISLPCS